MVAPKIRTSAIGMLNIELANGKSDGSLVGWGYSDSGQTNVPTGNDFVAIAGGHYHNLAIQQVVPEPATLALLALGLPLLVWRRSRRAGADEIHGGGRIYRTAVSRAVALAPSDQ